MPSVFCSLLWGVRRTSNRAGRIAAMTAVLPYQAISGIRGDHRGMQDVALRPLRQRIERPAGGEHQLISVGERIDPRLVVANDGCCVGPIAEGLAVGSRDIDLVANPDIAQEVEMGV